MITNNNYDEYFALIAINPQKKKGEVGKKKKGGEKGRKHIEI